MYRYVYKSEYTVYPVKEFVCTTIVKFEFVQLKLRLQGRQRHGTSWGSTWPWNGTPRATSWWRARGSSSGRLPVTTFCQALQRGLNILFLPFFFNICRYSLFPFNIFSLSFPCICTIVWYMHVNIFESYIIFCC